MKIHLSKEQIKFLKAILGPMNDEEYKVIINRSVRTTEKEKEELYYFVDKRKASDLYKLLFNCVNEINGSVD